MAHPSDIFYTDNPLHEFNREDPITIKLSEIMRKVDEHSEDYAELVFQENMYGASEFIDWRKVEQIAKKYGIDSAIVYSDEEW